MNKGLTSDEHQIAGSQIRTAFEDGNDSTFAKAFFSSIFVEVEAPFLLVIEEVEVLLGKFLLDCFFVFASSKGGRPIDAKAIGIDF